MRRILILTVCVAVSALAASVMSSNDAHAAGIDFNPKVTTPKVNPPKVIPPKDFAHGSKQLQYGK